MGESLIVYFSRTGENYGVGYVDKGNTEIVAEYVQELTGADLFKVEPTVPYSDKYDVCIKEAKERIGAAPIQATPRIGAKISLRTRTATPTTTGVFSRTTSTTAPPAISKRAWAFTCATRLLQIPRRLSATSP